MEVAISRRLADTALSLLVTQDDGDKTAALTLLEAAHRVVGLSGAEVHAEDTASWQSRVLALEGQLKAAVDLKDSFARDCENLAKQWDALHSQRLIGIKREDLDALKAGRDALQVKLTEALADAAAHFEDVKTARDEADALRQKVATLERDHAALGFTDQWETWARNLLGVDDGTAQELQVCIAKKLTSHELRFNLNMGLHKETEAWSAWAERTSGRHNPTAPHARQVIERRIGDMAAVCDALKLDREASHEDIIETIKSLQADRATLAERVMGDAPVPVDAPRFKIGDRVAVLSQHKRERYATVIDNDDHLYAVKFDNSGDAGSCDAIVAEYLRPLPKVDP